MFERIGRFFSPARSAPMWVRIMPYAFFAFLGVTTFLIAGAGWEYTNSNAFCGTSCHTMPAEYISFWNRPMPTSSAWNATSGAPPSPPS